ncbi:MAG TPA: hypothetical protein VHN11_18090 [Xanthobacteraceae bacterium]|jgi:hypothetical protein|nr:hypothetical protein [Xanthobacteraceae bacterium]
MRRLVKNLIAAGAFGAMSLGFVSASASPILTHTTAMKAAVPSTVMDVQWRWRGPGWRGGWGWNPGAVVGGVILGTTLGLSATYPYYGYGYGYGGYPTYAYSYPYFSGPGYAAPYPYPYGYAVGYYPGYYWGPSYYRRWW